MNYPIWEIPSIGGGTLVAIISVLHVYISHLAVGGGIFIWLLDRKAAQTNDALLNDFLRRYNWIFLLVTMVFGGVSGVGIWFIIGLVSPAATSLLIHNFVFGWAIEWVFFVGEIVALLLYHYRFDTMPRAVRTKIAFFYALFAWLSLFIINGILSFMLTPGKWLETQNFWHGFLNPTYFSSLFFRTFLTVMIAGIFAFLVGSYQKKEDSKKVISRIGIKWLIAGIAGMIPTGLWYWFSLPGDVKLINFAQNPQMSLVFNLFLILTPIILILGLLYFLKPGGTPGKLTVWIVSIVGLIWMGGFEYSREIARKPFVIRNVMYSTGMLLSYGDPGLRKPFLTDAKWTSTTETDLNNWQDGGKELFNLQCLACHTLGGRNDILSRTEIFTFQGMRAQLLGQGKVLGYMPPFFGSMQEVEALAAYITKGLHGKEIVTEPPLAKGKPLATDIPPFNKRKDDHILLAWNDLGMHCISDSDPWFVFLPPANTIEAQLIKRGDPPELITDDVEISYEAEDAFKNPAGKVKFWDYAERIFGAKLEKNVGLKGKGIAGTMDLNEDSGVFTAHAIPVVPYPEDGSFNPFPQLWVRAKQKSTGKLLAETKVVAPTSTEMGCKNCHGGGWQKEYGGMADETAKNILAAHDRINGTTLLADAEKGNPKLCQSCHPDPAVGSQGLPGHLSLSAAMHGWHANYIDDTSALACQQCHPAHPNNITRCMRGIHSIVGKSCVECHGSLGEHALSLLLNEPDIKSSPLLQANLKTVRAARADIKPRTSWVNQPDCLGCHVDFEKPEPDATPFNQWVSGFDELYRNRTGEIGIKCEACHGSPHSLYPSANKLDVKRGNIQPLQYTGLPYPIGSDKKCSTCHTANMDEAIHHENMYRMFRNKKLMESVMK